MARIFNTNGEFHDALSTIKERYPRAMRNALGIRVIEVPGIYAQAVEIRYKDDSLHSFTITDINEIHEKLQKIEINLRPREAWELHH